MTPPDTTPPDTLIRKALAEACPAVRDGEADDAIAGLTPSFMASPASLDEAAAVMRAAAGHGLAVIPRGAGTRLGWGTPPRWAGEAGTLVIDTLSMDKVIEHTAGDLVVRVQAGARMGAIGDALAAAGQEIALDVPAESTAGGIVASGLTGPRRLRYGSPRDLLIGITIVRADGTVAHSGGKVVKNVAGYDLGKLFCGSWGTLGLIAEVTFRLHPLPAARAYVTAEFPAAGPLWSASLPSLHDVGATDAIALAANSPLIASAVQLHRPSLGGPVHVGVLLEGSADGVAARSARLAEAIGAGEGTRVSAEPPSWWPGTRPETPENGDGTVIQVSFWQSALPGVLEAIDVADPDGRVRPSVGGPAGAGLLYVRPDAGASAEAVARFTGALREKLHHSRGSVIVLRAPEAVRLSLDSRGGMNGPVPSLRLMRAVKDQFDPEGRMSPGKFPEGTK
ncbi:MAG TPA: FAD-binding oxidoreductase [Trebonia sp.]|nr:FAD-binding oxidoreductase [Trebonia sp.]